LSFEVMTPVPNIVSRPIRAPFLRSQEHPSHERGAVVPGAHECRQHDAGYQADTSGCIDPKGQADEVFVRHGKEEKRRQHIEQPHRRDQPVIHEHFAFTQDASHIA